MKEPSFVRVEKLGQPRADGNGRVAETSQTLSVAYSFDSEREIGLM